LRVLRHLLDRFSPTVPDCENRYCLNQIQRFEAVLQKNGHSLSSVASIFEFGCGKGRLLAHIHRLLPGVQISGCDVLSESLELCKRRIPAGRFWKNQVRPPLGCDPERFDLIYSYSVFTHLAEDNHIAWLRELARLLKPGGAMIHTTKSYAFLRRASFFSPQSLEKYRLPDPLDDFTAVPTRFYYLMDNPSLPEYGLTIISRNYVEQKWLEYSGLDFLDYHEGAIEAYPEGCHDLVLLKKALR
jgi:SAM-dependent methyltransferase